VAFVFQLRTGGYDKRLNCAIRKSAEPFVCRFMPSEELNVYYEPLRFTQNWIRTEFREIAEMLDCPVEDVQKMLGLNEKVSSYWMRTLGGRITNRKFGWKSGRTRRFIKVQKRDRQTEMYSQYWALGWMKWVKNKRERHSRWFGLRGTRPVSLSMWVELGLNRENVFDKFSWGTRKTAPVKWIREGFVVRWPWYVLITD